MNLSFLLSERARTDHPIRVALIGCGKFATMYLTPVSYTHLTLPTILLV